MNTQRKGAMFSHGKASEYGKKSAILSRKRSENKYYSNPNHCLNCNKIIPTKPGVRVSITKDKKFCSRHCSGVYNNKKFPKRKPNPINTCPTSICRTCGDTIYLKKITQYTFYKRVRCDKCLVLLPNTKKIGRRYLSKKIIGKTKKEIFDSYKSWQTARSQILNNAFLTYHLSKNPKECAICSYKKHFQVCHIKPVSDFDDDALIETINSLRNLIPLCPTHHWELDHNCLDNPELVNIFIEKYNKI